MDEWETLAKTQPEGDLARGMLHHYFFVPRNARSSDRLEHERGRCLEHAYTLPFSLSLPLPLSPPPSPPSLTCIYTLPYIRGMKQASMSKLEGEVLAGKQRLLELRAKERQQERIMQTVCVFVYVCVSVCVNPKTYLNSKPIRLSQRRKWRGQHKASPYRL